MMLSKDFIDMINEWDNARITAKEWVDDGWEPDYDAEQWCYCLVRSHPVGTGFSSATVSKEIYLEVRKILEKEKIPFG